MTPIFRPGTLEDSYAVYLIFVQAIDDFVRRTFPQAQPQAQPEQPLDAWWPRRQALFEHLARTADQFWMAEEAGQPIGYARSIRRDDTLELTEFFVLPGHQSAGVGRELLARAFPAGGARHRSIIATTDARAQSRYLRAGCYPRYPIYSFGRAPETVAVPTDLSLDAFEQAETVLADLAPIDQVVLGYRRDPDHRWLAETRQGYLYRRGGQVVGYGYLGRAGAYSGPFALLDAPDYPAVLAHAETYAAAQQAAEVGFEVPLINRHAVDYLLHRGYQMDRFFAFYMSDAPLGQPENYIVTSPPFFM